MTIVDQIEKEYEQLRLQRRDNPNLRGKQIHIYISPDHYRNLPTTIGGGFVWFMGCKVFVAANPLRGEHPPFVMTFV